MSKKKIGIIIAVIVIIAAAAGGAAWYFLNGNLGVGNSADKVYVEKVSTLNAAKSGVQNRYSGVVEAQESWKVNKDAEREVKEVFVEQGDMVEEGDPLFEYNMEDVQSELSQAELELEGMENEITDFKSQITQLTKERNAASSDEKFQYTAEIQEKENSIKQTEYNIESKKAEMEKKRQSIDNAVVTSKIAGVVKSINESGNSDYASEEDSAYMTVLAVGDFRVKGTVSESNVQMLSEEQQVILRSRIDEEQTWTGTISKIDTQNETSDDNNDMMMYDSGSTAEKATKYPFYITLDSTDGLMMGQHLFIELDEGQTEEKEGIWLFEGYIVREDANAEGAGGSESGDAALDLSAGDMAEGFDAAAGDMADAENAFDEISAGAETADMDMEGAEDGSEGADTEDLEGGAEDADTEDGAEDADMEGTEDGAEDVDMEGTEDGAEDDADASSAEGQSAYVWAVDGRNKLEKRPVKLGEYDEAMGAYEILSGLTEDDYIAFPMEGLYEGVTAVTNAEDVDYTSPLYNQGEEGEMSEGGEEIDEEGMPDSGGMANGGGEPMDDGTSEYEDTADEEGLDDESLDDDSSDDDSSDDDLSDDDISGDEDSPESGPSISDSLMKDGQGDTDLGGFEALQ